MFEKHEKQIYLPCLPRTTILASIAFISARVWLHKWSFEIEKAEYELKCSEF